MLSGLACQALNPSICEQRRGHCDVVCEREHPYNVNNREKCFHKCERHFEACLGEPPVIIEREPPVIVEPYPPVIVEPWGWGWHHHHHWR